MLDQAVEKTHCQVVFVYGSHLNVFLSHQTSDGIFVKMSTQNFANCIGAENNISQAQHDQSQVYLHCVIKDWNSVMYIRNVLITIRNKILYWNIGSSIQNTLLKYSI